MNFLWTGRPPSGVRVSNVEVLVAGKTAQYGSIAVLPPND
jgi:hypothetical protein